MDNLTEEQRQRIQLNRQRALEMGERRTHIHREKENTSQTTEATSRPENSCSTSNEMTMNNDKPARESFGDSGIDWGAAACEMDRILSNTTAGAGRTGATQSTTSTTRNGTKLIVPTTNDQYGGDNDAYLDSSKRQRTGIIHNNTNMISNNQKSRLTEEQKARIEENRQKALAKKLQNSQQQQAVSNNGLSKTACSSPTMYNADQRARIEENRQKALAKRQQKQLLLLPPTNNNVHQTNTTTTTVRCPSPTIVNDEQRARIEENRRRALEKRQQLSQSTALTKTQCPSPTIVNDEQRARIEENRQKALAKRQQKQLLLPPTNHPQNQSVLGTTAVPSAVAALPNNMQYPSPDRDGMKLSARDQSNNAQELDESELKMPAQEKQSTTTSSVLPGPAELANQHTQPTSPIKKAAARTPKKSGLPPIPQDLHYEESRVLPIYDDDLDDLIENAELDEPLLNGWTLFDHQKEGVTRGLKMRRLILAFDMGLGKTIIGCVWAKAFLNTLGEGLKVFVIAPVSLHDDWKRTAIEATGLKLDTGGKKKKKKKSKAKRKNKDPEKTVTGKRRKKKKIASDSDSEHEDESDDESIDNNSVDLHIMSWSKVDDYKKVINDIDDYVVIADEAHNMQNVSSKRTEEALKLMFPKKCRGVLLLSGTPMKNGKPSNLYPLLKAVRHPFGDNQRRYEFFFCNGQQKMFRGVPTWDASGSSNLKELNAHTSSHIFRMTKEDALKELPPRKRELKKVPVSPRHEMRYTQAVKDLAEAYSLSTIHGTGGGDNDDILALFQKLRQISSNAKVDSVVALSNSILMEESSIVIFTNFVAVAREIYEKLEEMSWQGELLTGETAPKKRQAMVDRFQTNLSPVFICTYGAGGVGLTLTAACTVVLVDRPWTPGDVCQAEDRIRRIGQKRPVRSVWIRAFPIDEQIDELIDHKEVNSNTAVDGKDSDGLSKSAPKVSIAQLVKSVLSNSNQGSM